MDVAATILLVEDNPGDVVLACEAVKEAGIRARLDVARSGQEAMTYLQDASRKAALPDLVILDLNLPTLNGREVLAQMKADSGLSLIPVAILTTSRDETDVCQGYTVGRISYFVKPQHFRELVAVMRQIETFRKTAGL
jgi:DNA-binding response OmpR family regulator